MLASDFTTKDQARFWDKVDMAAPFRCWNWYASTNRHGYGAFGTRHDSRTKIRLAHRIAYTLAFGTMPDELDVLHDCDNPSCCNPEHLWLGTALDNHVDCALKGRHSPPPLWRAHQHPMSKLTPEQVVEIRACQHGMKELAARCGINIRTAFRIRSGHNYKPEQLPADYVPGANG